jgi:metal-responsive CopG/Arc/MetJ family transcriptional regulator
MMSTMGTKLKVSLTLSEDLLALVDRDAKRRHETRSGVVEQWLRRAATASAEKEIEEATAAYYLSMRSEELAEDEALSHALSDAARRVSYGESPVVRRRRGRR